MPLEFCGFPCWRLTFAGPEKPAAAPDDIRQAGALDRVGVDFHGPDARRLSAVGQDPVRDLIAFLLRHSVHTRQAKSDTAAVRALRPVLSSSVNIETRTLKRINVKRINFCVS